MYFICKYYYLKQPKFLSMLVSIQEQLRGLVNTKIYKIYVIAVRVHFENQK